jgi:hypothetical protein
MSVDWENVTLGDLRDTIRSVEVHAMTPDQWLWLSDVLASSLAELIDAAAEHAKPLPGFLLGLVAEGIQAVPARLRRIIERHGAA